MSAHGLAPDVHGRAVNGLADAARRELAALAARYARPAHERWVPVPAEHDVAIAADVRLAEVARLARAGLLRDVLRRLAPMVPGPAVARYVDALVEVPRERFVLPEDIASSSDDTPLPLDPQGLATVSAPHAYLLSYALLELQAGDRLAELGTGTGYGAALGRAIVGPRGHVSSIEIDSALADRARRLHGLLRSRAWSGVTLLEGDAQKLGSATVRAACDPVRDVAAIDNASPLRIVVTFALPATPDWLIALLPEGGRLVAPIGTGDGDQQLVRWVRRDGTTHRTTHGAVRYVTERR